MAVFWRGSVHSNWLSLCFQKFWSISNFADDGMFCFKLWCNSLHITPTFLNKKFERLRAFLVVFLAKFFQKTNFFQKFLHFWNRLDELVGKMVLFFHFDELHILSFLALDCLKSNFKMKTYAQDIRNKLKMNHDYEKILTFCLYTL